MQVSFVLWNGALGGAETFSCYLAAEMRSKGVDARVVFVTGSEPLSARLDERSVPWTALNFSRGRAVLRKSRAYAREVRGQGHHGAILMRAGFLATALRLGGYRGRIIAVDHGDILRKRQVWDRAISARVIDVEVAGSKLMLKEMESLPHADELLYIPNGISVDLFRPTRPLSESGCLTIGWAGRFVPGKGVDLLLEANRLLMDEGHDIRTRIAGDGPMRAELHELRQRLGLFEQVEFIGRTNDTPAFWNSCDLAVASSSHLVESLGMTPLEAAACGRPAVVSRNGGLVEIVSDSETGRIVPPGNPDALAEAIARYALDRNLLRAHGEAARERVVAEFSMADCASAYLAAMGCE